MSQVIVTQTVERVVVEGDKEIVVVREASVQVVTAAQQGPPGPANEDAELLSWIL